MDPTVFFVSLLLRCLSLLLYLKASLLNKDLQWHLHNSLLRCGSLLVSTASLLSASLICPEASSLIEFFIIVYDVGDHNIFGVSIASLLITSLLCPEALSIV